MVRFELQVDGVVVRVTFSWCGEGFVALLVGTLPRPHTFVNPADMQLQAAKLSEVFLAVRYGARKTNAVVNVLVFRQVAFHLERLVALIARERPFIRVNRQHVSRELRK
jgi:hypothetical protein